LSGCLPIDTRPQARANLGERQIGALEMHCKKKRHVSLKNFENLGGAPRGECAQARRDTPSTAR
jgi:hypothetical protein